ncbi:MAG: pyridoxamine 5'-phosphate oxidase family protein [Pseudomonadota bacterium]
MNGSITDDASPRGGWIEDLAALEALYGETALASTVKVADRITPEYRALIEASPFLALATAGTEGLDCSPRGDAGPALHIEDERTLHLPDRRGNNRIDSLRNILRDPRVALLCLIPGSGTTLRINGRARINAEPSLLARHAEPGAAPRSVIVITLEEIYFQCARAVLRSRLWAPESRRDPAALPSPGRILEAQSRAAIDAAAYDAEWPGRAAKTLW